MPVATAARTSPAQRNRLFLQEMERRYSLRLHMAVILGLTFVAGLVVTKLFLLEGNTDLALRYGVAVLVSYLAFLVLIWLWLGWMQGESVEPDLDDALDVADVLTTDTPGAADSLLEVPDEPEGCLVAVAVALVLALAVGVFSAAFLLWSAPTLLAEVAFEAMLAPSLYRGVRRAAATGWVRTAVRSTIVPFAVTLVAGIAFGTYAGRACPDARRVVAVVECARLR